MKNNKRGISAIVATVLIILITVAAVTIIWAAIIPMIQGNLEGGTVCLDASSNVQILDEGYTCYNSSGDDYVSIQLGMGSADLDLADAQLLIDNAGDTTTYNLVDGDPVFTDSALTTQATSSDLPDPNQKKVFYVNVSGQPDKVSIAPVVATGASSTTCDVSSSQVIRACN